jgi:hypothetical protein
MRMKSTVIRLLNRKERTSRRARELAQLRNVILIEETDSNTRSLPWEYVFQSEERMKYSWRGLCYQERTAS